jgi:hypothetical protein
MSEYRGYIALIPRTAGLRERLDRFLPLAPATMLAALSSEEVWDRAMVLPETGHKLVFEASGVQYTAYQYSTVRHGYLLLAVRYSNRNLAPSGGLAGEGLRHVGVEAVPLDDRPVEEQVRAFLAARS